MSNKHDANVRKRPMLNFQIGLIASLLFTYVMFEIWTTEPIKIAVSDPDVDFIEEVFSFPPDFKIEKPKTIAVVKSKPKPVPILEKVEVIKDDVTKDISKEEYKFVKPTETSAPVKIEDIVEEGDKEVIEMPFTAVEFVPVYPGCEGLNTNKERASCFSERIKKLVSKKFNGDLGAELGLTGLQRIYVQFDVERDGTIQNIKARGPHPRLEKEAIRVVGKLPQMKPGMQRDTPVRVKYSLPIAFKIFN